MCTDLQNGYCLFVNRQNPKTHCRWFALFSFTINQKWAKNNFWTQLPSAALSCPQLPSAALSCPQLPSAALSCPQLPSAAISCHQLPSAALSCPQLPSVTLREYFSIIFLQDTGNLGVKDPFCTAVYSYFYCLHWYICKLNFETSWIAFPGTFLCDKSIFFARESAKTNFNRILNRVTSRSL